MKSPLPSVRIVLLPFAAFWEWGQGRDLTASGSKIAAQLQINLMLFAVEWKVEACVCVCFLYTFANKLWMNPMWRGRASQERVPGSWSLVIADRLWELLLCRGSLDWKSKAEEGNRPQLCSTLTASSERNAHSCWGHYVFLVLCPAVFQCIASWYLSPVVSWGLQCLKWVSHARCIIYQPY